MVKIFICSNKILSNYSGWPPDPTNSSQWPPWKILRETRPGNPYYGPRMQLYSTTGWLIGIYSEHDVRGSRDVYDKFSNYNILFYFQAQNNLVFLLF